MGWVLSSPVSCKYPESQQYSNLVTPISLSVLLSKFHEGLEGEVKKLWDSDTLDIKTLSILEEFLRKLIHKGDHYQVNLHGRLHIHCSLIITS